MTTRYFFEKILGGELPRGSMILVVGEPGTGKTIFTSSIACDMLSKGKKVLYVSFNETEGEYLELMGKLGLKLEGENFKFLELFTAGPDVAKTQLGFIYDSITEFHPELVVIDSITSILSVFKKEDVRSFLHTTLGKFLKKFGATAILIAEKPMESPGIGVGVEEFVADGVIILRYEKHGEYYRRVMEIPKMRGRKIEKPSYEYVITDNGFFFLDVPELEREAVEVSFEKITSGIEELDEILNGGLYRDSITLIIGTTGSGKTTFGLHFAFRNALEGRRALFITFEETKNAILKAMRNYGMDEKSVGENLKIISWIPEAQSPVSYYVEMIKELEDFGAEILIIDSLSALEERMNRVGLEKLLRYLQLYVKRKGITTMMTMNLDVNPEREMKLGVSTLADNIVLLWNEIESDALKRRLLIYKSRGSHHSRKVCGYEITSKGIEISGR